MTPERLGSRYLLEERIGEGGLGIVWRGRDISAGTTYAIKLLRAEHAQDPATVARFVRERTALLRFRHPNVVTLHDMIVEGDRLALVMDFIADGDLNAHLRRRGGVLPLDEATELTAQISSALAAAHAVGIVHRDLKPANVLLDGDPGRGDPGRGAEVRLTDFGIAQVSGEPTVTTKGFFLGTLSYLAPEVIQGGHPPESASTPASPTPEAPTGTTGPSTAAVPPPAAPAPAPSSTTPANTAWQCGPTAAATLYSTNAGTGQTMQACIRVYDGKLELEGTLSPVVASWDEQIVLVLKDSSENDHGDYTSPVCTTANCVYSVTVTPPARGAWTVLPQWERYNGSYQSTGHQPALVNF